MKKLIYFAFAATSLLLVACAKTDKQPAPQGRVVTLSATIEVDEDTKAFVTDAGAFTWASGDQIGVWTSNGESGKFTCFTLSGVAGNATAEFSGTLDEGYSVVAGPVVYPYRAAHSYNAGTQELTFNQPSDMNFEGGNATKSHMAAMYSGAGTITLKQLSGLIRFTVFNVPSTAGYIRLRTNDKTTYGNFSVDMSAATPTIVASDAGSNQNFNLNFSSSPENVVGKMYVASFPVPTGTYGYFRVSVQKSGGDMIGNKEKKSSTTISRAQMINMPEVTVNTVELSDSEDGTVRSNFMKTDVGSPYANTEGTVLSVVSNPGLSVMDGSGKALKVDATAHSQGGYIPMTTKNSDYSDNFRDGAKAFAVKVRYESASDASLYYPKVLLKGGKVSSVDHTLRLPDMVNGQSFNGTAENWAELINPAGWNVLQWTCTCTGTWRVDITPFLDIDGNVATSGSRIIYFDDFRFLK